MSSKILVVDDEASIISMMKTSIELAGYEVVTASNGREALESVATERPDVVVMDVMMPEMDGFQALEKLKANPDTSHIPVVMLTGLNDDYDIAKGWKKGNSLYLQKPFIPVQLISYLQLILKLD